MNALRPLLVLLLLANSSIIYAQIPGEPVNIQSPTAMSFAVYGDIPVSYYSGLPSIEVPLYTLTENAISVPIDLRYHAAGFRPDVHPGWVGNNWNLTTGGLITRTVRDKRDDFPPGSEGIVNGFYHDQYQLLDNSNWETKPRIFEVLNTYNAFHGDTEPDEFSFNFLGYSGKFYLDHKRRWKVACDRPVKVEVDTTLIPMFLYDKNEHTPIHGPDGHHFPGFTITDEFGIRYIFGIDPAAIEFSTSFFLTSGYYWTAQAWYLTRIIHPDGYEVKFNYERDNDYINQMYSAFSFTPEYYEPTEIDYMNKPCTPAYTGHTSIDESYSGVLISPVYLSSIETSTETIQFKRSVSTELRYSTTPFDWKNPYDWKKRKLESDFPNPTPPLATVIQQTPGSATIQNFYTALDNRIKFKQLDTIEVFNNNGVSIKKFKLFFTSSTTKRLALDSVRQIGKYNEALPSYRFTYLPYAGGEPKYLENKIDHYGFYNGLEAGIPNDTGYFNKRSYVDTAKLKSGVLQSITYPTGGITNFEYEPHVYHKRIQEVGVRGLDNGFATNTICGGLRIKKIESWDQSTASVKKAKEYFYVTNYSSSTNPSTAPSSGILGARVKYIFEDYKTPILEDTNQIYRVWRTSSQTVLPACENSLGTHVGYSEVTEKLYDGSYSKHFFNNYGPGFLDDSAVVMQERTMYDKTNSRAMERGILNRTEHYTNTNKLLEKKLIEYIALNSSNEYVRAVNGTLRSICDNQNTAWTMFGTGYRIYTYSYLPKSEIVTSYSQTSTDSLVTKKYFFYNDTTRLLVKDSTVSSKSEPVCNYYYYPQDIIKYTPSAPAPVTQTLGYMKQKNMIGFPVQTMSTKKIGSNEFVTAINVTKFKDFNTIVKPYRVYRFSQPASQVTKSANHLYRVGFSGGMEKDTLPNNTELLATYSKYDLRGNITTLTKDQDISTAYLWRKDFKYLTAKAINSYNNLEYNYVTEPAKLIIDQPKVQYFTTGSFRHYQQGNITMKLILNGLDTTTLNKARIIIIVKNYSKDTILTFKDGETRTIVNAPAGIYSLHIYSDMLNINDEAKLVVTYNNQKANQTSSNTQSQFFYEGFEEAIPSSVKPFAGSNCHKGAYQVPYVVPSGGTYHIDYRYLDGGVWKYRKRSYTNNMTISEGTAIDEVRVFRTDMDIMTYTYDPDFGVTSQSDVNGKTEKYIYDGLGRLTTVKDEKDNILKRICYTYYGQTQNCTVSTSAIWEASGFTRCKPCPSNPTYTTTMRQKLLRDANPHSATYNDTMWVDDVITSDCYMTIPQAWQNIGSPYCEKNGVNNNTGYRLTGQQDTALCSHTYNSTRVVQYDYNPTACPINMTNIRLTTSNNLGSGYISFTNSSGTTTFYFPTYPVTNHLLGTIPADQYTILVYSGGTAYTFYANGTYAFNDIYSPPITMPVGGANWVLSTL